MPATETKAKTKTILTPLNRVEGDLEIRVELEDDRVVDAWSAGVMYRGFENLLRGRGALDGLVLTPRVCGICGTAHLQAAARALEAIMGVRPPANAIRVRNTALAVEHLQSDMRHAFLMFVADFVNPAYRDRPLYEEAARRYAPFRGETVIETIRETRSVVEVVAILGGQWPHSSYMVPGGITTLPNMSDICQCRYLLDRYRAWYEKRILGCSIDRWREVRSAGDLDAWLDESPAHRDGEVGFFVRFARDIGLDRIGRGHDAYIGFDGLPIPEGSAVRGRRENVPFLLPGGFATGTEVTPLDQARISEHVAHSWFEDYEGGRHPFEGETKPYATGAEGRKYSWVKAPRYGNRPAETGPLAEAVLAGVPLVRDLLRPSGPNAFVRQLARMTRPAELLPAVGRWIDEIDPGERYYTASPHPEEGEGLGAVEASRGALGHWLRIERGRIARYQMITPTAWNGSPRDSADLRGPWEEALVGTPVRDTENPVELGHVIRSFDACQVCSVHAFRGGRSFPRRKV
ncbi:MAG: nickel-dependent hydrogenase large subunit [Candidatus Eisenbacteria bacterium]|nr:nickel-dependent hydrogenase large subunit [Candidatus Eisenbacteria bacterium]